MIIYVQQEFEKSSGSLLFLGFALQMRGFSKARDATYLNIFIILVLGIFKADEFCTVDK